MKRIYNEPNVNLVSFSTCDVITMSVGVGEVFKWNEGTPDASLIEEE